MYYEARETGSIYSIRELVEAARREHMALDELAAGLTPLPYGTVMLIEEAETIAAYAEERRERDWLEGLWD